MAPSLEDASTGGKGDRHRERAVRDADRLGSYEARMVDLVVGDPAQNGRQRDLDLAARQRRAEAAVGTDPERDVPVRLAVDEHLVGSVEDLLIAVARRPHEQHAIAFGDRTATDLDVSLRRSRQRELWRADPKELLDRR